MVHLIWPLCLAHFGLAFPLTGPRRPRALRDDDLTLLERLQDKCFSELTGLGIDLVFLLDLLRDDDHPSRMHHVRRVVQAGLSLATTLALAKTGTLLEASQQAHSPAQLRAYSDWVVKLQPHYAALGVDLQLGASSFSSLYQATSSARERELSVLAHCLLRHHAGVEPAQATRAVIDRKVAQLDATIGLFQRAPQMARSLIAAIDGTSPGLARKLAPDFASWLQDDPLLDRYLHLLGQLEAPQTISRALRQDYSRHRRLAKERAYLQALPQRSETQERRLAALGKPVTASPGRTRRRLESRIGELCARVYRRQLDRLLIELLQQICDVRMKTLTPPWRDAVRFYLGVHQNRALLATLLRFAAAQPGRPIKRGRPDNHAWLQEARAHLDVEAWLSETRPPVEATIGEEQYRLTIEQDPLEVLRMGVPFDTCLALDSGCNAAATVINALDANKHVLYLRDAHGAIVARKLIAISSDWHLIGYHVYCSLDGDLASTVRTSIDDHCLQLGRAIGLELAHHGAPRQLHDGFWYDDVAEPFICQTPLPDAVKDYCQALGLPPPTQASAELLAEARAHAARQAGDVKAALAYWQRDHGPSQRMLGAWLVQQLGPIEAKEIAAARSILVGPLLRSIERESPERALAVAPDLENAGWWSVVENVKEILARNPPTPALALALLAAAERWRQLTEYDDHGLEHRTMDLLPPLVPAVPMADLWRWCPRIEALWDLVVREDPGCDVCRDGATHRLQNSALASFLAQPDPGALLACLRGRRRSQLGVRIALYIAARTTLYPRGRPAERLAPTTPLRLYADQPANTPAVVRELKRCAAQEPRWARHPDLYAALVRHAPQGPGFDDFVAALPRPEEAPFEALGALLYHCPRMLQHLQPWATPDLAPADWRPGPWELYYHRRVATPWRRQLRAAIDDPAQGRAALGWLAALGCVDELAAVPEPRRPGPLNALRAAARLAARLTDPADFFESADDKALRSLAAFKDSGSPGPGSAVDRAAVHAALDTVLAVVLEGRERALAPALDILWAAGDTTDFRQLLHLLAEQSDSLPEAVRSFLGRALRERCTFGVPQLDHRLFPRLWHQPDLRASVECAMGQTYEDSVHEDFERVVRANPDIDTSGMEASWIAALIEADRDVYIWPRDRAHARSLGQGLLERISPEAWASLYVTLPDHLSAAGFLEALAASDKWAAVRQASDEEADDDDESLSRSLRDWLRRAAP